jgi:hypothetical protein
MWVTIPVANGLRTQKVAALVVQMTVKAAGFVAVK